MSETRKAADGVRTENGEKSNTLERRTGPRRFIYRGTGGFIFIMTAAENILPLPRCRAVYRKWKEEKKKTRPRAVGFMPCALR